MRKRHAATHAIHQHADQVQTYACASGLATALEQFAQLGGVFAAATTIVAIAQLDTAAATASCQYFYSRHGHIAMTQRVLYQIAQDHLQSRGVTADRWQLTFDHHIQVHRFALR